MRKRTVRFLFRSAVLLVVALAWAASAANSEIPQKLLDHEARVRASFTPAQRARVSALETRLTTKMSVAEVTAMTRGESPNSIFAVLMAYQKMLDKEARADQETERIDQRMALAAKQGKLDLEKAKIDAEKREASERFDRAMTAAQAQMALGIASGAAQGTAGAAAAFTVSPATARGATVPTKTPTKAPGSGK